MSEGLHPENNGLTVRCACIGNRLCNCHEKAAADLSCGKNICCSRMIPGASWKRERGHERAPNNAPLKGECEPSINSLEQIV